MDLSAQPLNFQIDDLKLISAIRDRLFSVIFPSSLACLYSSNRRGKNWRENLSWPTIFQDKHAWATHHSWIFWMNAIHNLRHNFPYFIFAIYFFFFSFWFILRHHLLDITKQWHDWANVDECDEQHKSKSFHSIIRAHNLLSVHQFNYVHRSLFCLFTILVYQSQMRTR